MGTRHLIAAVVNGTHKIAQYGQWDGNPGGQGMTALAFCRDIPAGAAREAFKAKLEAARLMDEKELALVHAEIEANNDLLTTHRGKYRHLSRDMGAEILGIVANSDPGIKLQDEYAFAGDSLYCEWAYVVDLDKSTFEIFKGFNKDPLEKSERFSNLVGQHGYTPIKLVKSYPLDDLPTDDQFINDTDPSEEDED